MRPPWVLLAVVTLVAPLAVAEDHVYAHRFVFEGRLLGGDGLPLPGREVTFLARGDSFDETCPGVPPGNVTDAWGDFRFCFHKHVLYPSTRVGVQAGNASVVTPVDTGTRRTVVALVDPAENGTAPDGWETTHRVDGRVWRQGAARVEGVDVYGDIVGGAPVAVTVTGSDGNREFHNATTDDQGDFLLRLEIRDPHPENVTVQVAVEGRTQARPLDLAGHRLVFGVVLPPLPDQPDLAPTAPPQGAPGAAAPPVSPLLLAAAGAGLLGAGALAWGRRRRAP